MKITTNVVSLTITKTVIKLRSAKCAWPAHVNDVPGCECSEPTCVAASAVRYTGSGRQATGVHYHGSGFQIQKHRYYVINTITLTENASPLNFWHPWLSWTECRRKTCFGVNFFVRDSGLHCNRRRSCQCWLEMWTQYMSFSEKELQNFYDMGSLLLQDSDPPKPFPLLPRYFMYTFVFFLFCWFIDSLLCVKYWCIDTFSYAAARVFIINSLTYLLSQSAIEYLQITLWLLFVCSQIVTCATDKNLSMWDVEVGERVRKYRGHQTFVNTCDIARRGPQMLCSGSDDGTLRVCWTLLRHLLHSQWLYQPHSRQPCVPVATASAWNTHLHCHFVPSKTHLFRCSFYL